MCIGGGGGDVEAAEDGVITSASVKLAGGSAVTLHIIDILTDLLVSKRVNFDSEWDASESSPDASMAPGK